MPAKKYVVKLSEEDRNTLEWFISTGERKAEDNTRARILLKADDGLTDSKISEHVGCSSKTVANTRKAYCDTLLHVQN
jgi:AraC-like DNA-binding protein